MSETVLEAEKVSAILKGKVVFLELSLKDGRKLRLHGTDDWRLE